MQICYDYILHLFLPLLVLSITTFDDGSAVKHHNAYHWMLAMMMMIGVVMIGMKMMTTTHQTASAQCVCT